MVEDFSIFVGTVGTGVWQSPDFGQSWAPARGGLSVEQRVYSLAIDPNDPAVVYVGSHQGIHRSENRGQSYTALGEIPDGREVWRIAVDPSDPNTIFAGTRPSALFRSTDRGETWDKLALDLAETCPAVGVPRVTSPCRQSGGYAGDLDGR